MGGGGVAAGADGDDAAGVAGASARPQALTSHIEHIRARIVVPERIQRMISLSNVW
jgi:hypothetical protein